MSTSESSATEPAATEPSETSEPSAVVLTVFRSRLDPNHVGAYRDRAAEMSALAVDMPGYLSHKVFTADDGERVTVVEFDSADHQRAWATHADHRQAMGEGVDRYYLEYDLKVATVTKHHHFDR